MKEKARIMAGRHRRSFTSEAIARLKKNPRQTAVAVISWLVFMGLLVAYWVG